MLCRRCQAWSVISHPTEEGIGRWSFFGIMDINWQPDDDNGEEVDGLRGSVPRNLGAMPWERYLLYL